MCGGGEFVVAPGSMIPTLLDIKNHVHPAPRFNYPTYTAHLPRDLAREIAPLAYEFI